MRSEDCEPNVPHRTTGDQSKDLQTNRNRPNVASTTTGEFLSVRKSMSSTVSHKKLETQIEEDLGNVALNFDHDSRSDKNNACSSLLFRKANAMQHQGQESPTEDQRCQSKKRVQYLILDNRRLR